MASIVGDILCPLPGVTPILLTDGPNAYGAAVAGASATLVYGVPPNDPTGTYTAAALGVSRPYISGHLAPVNDPSIDPCYWRVPLDAAVLSAWDVNGDWLLIDSVAYTPPPGGRGEYPEELWGISSLPNPISSAPAPWLTFGIYARSSPPGGGSYAGVEWPGIANTLKCVISAFNMDELYQLTGHGLPNDSIGVYVQHKLGNTVTQYVAVPGTLYPTHSHTGTLAAPGAPPSNPIFFSQRYGYGNNGMEDVTRPLVSGLIAGSLTVDQVQSIVDAILGGVPVYVPPTAPPVTASLRRVSGGACEGARISLAWDASEGADGYQITTAPPIGEGAVETADTSLTLAPATIGVSYAVQVRAFRRDCLGATRYSAPVSLLATPCAPGALTGDCYSREPNPTTAYTRLPGGCACDESENG